MSDQQQNAKLFAKYNAVITLQDDVLSGKLSDTIIDLLSDDTRSSQLADNLHQFAKPHAARDMARLLATAAYNKGGR